jgi:lipopolysaccharide export system permease protein
MRKINRYIGSTVSSAILLVLTVIIGLNAIAGIVDEMGELEGNYDFVAALKYVLLSIPGSLYEYLPFAALVGSLAGLGVLAGNSELVVMRSAGISTGRIVWMVMRPALVIMALGFGISEYIAPHTESIAKSQRAIALRAGENLVSREGLWHREGNSFMHFNAVQPGGVLYGVTIYRFNDKLQLLSSTYAERATYQQQTWLLEDVSENSLAADSVSSQRFSSKVWRTDLTPALLGILVLDPMDLSVTGLWQYSGYLEGQGLNSGSYRLAFWKKVLQPLSTVALVLIAISFIFGPLREVTMGYRIFTGVLVGIVFRTVQDMLGPASLVYGFAPILASLLPIIVCLMIGGYMLSRAR